MSEKHVNKFLLDISNSKNDINISHFDELYRNKENGIFRDITSYSKKLKKSVFNNFFKNSDLTTKLIGSVYCQVFTTALEEIEKQNHLDFNKRCYLGILDGMKVDIISKFEGDKNKDILSKASNERYEFIDQSMRAIVKSSVGKIIINNYISNMRYARNDETTTKYVDFEDNLKTLIFLRDPTLKSDNFEIHDALLSSRIQYDVKYSSKPYFDGVLAREISKIIPSVEVLDCRMDSEKDDNVALLRKSIAFDKRWVYPLKKFIDYEKSDIYKGSKLNWNVIGLLCSDPERTGLLYDVNIEKIIHKKLFDISNNDLPPRSLDVIDTIVQYLQNDKKVNEKTIKELTSDSKNNSYTLSERGCILKDYIKNEGKECRDYDNNDIIPDNIGEYPIHKVNEFFFVNPLKK